MKNIIVKNESDVVDSFAESYLLRIHDDVSNIQKGFIRLGFHLYEIKQYEYYISTGYDDFYEFCEANYGFSPSTTKRYIEVWYEFGMRGLSSLPKMFIDEKYEDYSYSQLVEMLPLDESERLKISPTMTVKEIRSLKKELRQKKKETVSEIERRCDVAPELKECKPELDIYKSELDMQRENILEQLGVMYGSLDVCWKLLSDKDREDITREYEILKGMIQFLH